MPLFTFARQGGRPSLRPWLFLRLAPGAGSGQGPQGHRAGLGDGAVSRPGRPQNPLPDGPAADVAAELRRLRERAGLTFRALADDSGYSLATATAALGGRRLPS